MRTVLKQTFVEFAVMIMTAGLSQAQTSDPPATTEATPPLPLFGPTSLRSLETDPLFAQQPAGPAPTPRHTGIKALATHLVTNFKYLPSTENLFWAGAGGGLALAAHPFDDDVNRKLVGNDTAENIFKAGEILGELGTLLGSASAVYAVGRIKDQPKV